jgi:hypothetical protein
MGKMIDIDKLQALLDGQNEGTFDSGGPKLKLTKDANTNQDFEGIASAVGDMALRKWRGKTDDFVRSDAQIVTHAKCALTHTLAGFYEKPPRERVWADGRYVTITDAGASAGDEFIEWERSGRRHTDVDDGIMAPADSPQRAVGEDWDTQSAQRAIVKHKVQIDWFSIQRAARRGYDKFEKKGRDLRNQHMRSINNIIRRGNINHNLRGIVNYPGIRHRAASVDWGSAAAGPIYDDYNAAINQIYASPTEEDIPALGILPRRQHRHIETENFGAGTDTTLLTYIEKNNRSHEVVIDPGLAEAGPTGEPVALFMTPREDLVFVTAPLYAQVQQPHDVSTAVMEVEIWTAIFGVQVNDEDTILVVDGAPAGWQKFG